MKRLISIILAVVMLITFGSVFADEPSDWAIEAIEDLQELGHFDSSIFKDFENSATRGEFIYFAVRMYEILSGHEIEVNQELSFTDTNDIYALKGSTIGITNGLGDGSFGYDNLLTREQLSTFMIRTINLLNIEMKEPSTEKFSDHSKISDWALESIYSARSNGIISGVGNNMVNPKGEASLQVTMVITNRILNEKNGLKATTVNGDEVTIDINRKPVVEDNNNIPVDEDLIVTDPSDFQYEINNGEVTLTGYSGTNKDVVIPSEIDGLPVTVIGNSAFFDKQLISVIIPNSVTVIGGYAFYDNQLISVKIPDSVTEIGADSFSYNQLTSVVIPDSVTVIGGYAFYGNQLISVKIPDSVTEIVDFTFTNNQLTSVVIPDSVTEIGADSFSYNQLTSVVIPDSVTEIGWNAFSYNQLTSVVIPDSVTVIGGYAFSDNQLTSVELPKDCEYESDSFDQGVEITFK